MLRSAIVALLFSLAITPAAQAQAQAQDRLTVLLEWFVNPDHAPLVVARELGLFEKTGLEVELLPPADPSIVPRAVAAGRAEVGIHYQPSLYLDHAEGIPLVRFGTLVETPLNTLTVLADGPISGIEDLEGKRIGFSVSGFEDAMLGRMLEHAGVDPKSVELINVNFALTSSLISGQVDATIGGFRNFELTQMRLAGHEGRAFFPEEEGIPVYDELIFVTRPDLLEDERLTRFLEAVEQGAIHLTNHPDESWELFIRAFPDLDDELNRQAWIDTLPRFAKRPFALDHRRYARFGAFMAESGLIERAPPVEEIKVGFDILKSLGLRHRGVNIIACPSCARQGFNVIETVGVLEERLAHITTPMSLSIIGCVVNGPGEALFTDIGFTGGGKGAGMVYLAGKMTHKQDNAGMIEHIVELVERRAAEIEAAAPVAAPEPLKVPARAG